MNVFDVFVCFFLRKRFSLKKFSIPSLVSNAVTPRAYMSSLSAAEDIHKNEASKAYGSDQIQVFFFYLE
jgi:DNA gyrase subunit B